MKEKLAKQLIEDLTAINSFLNTKGPLPPSFVRITASAILRKWFVEKWIDKLANLSNVQYTFPSLNTFDVVKAINENNEIKFYMTGGILLNGLPIQGYYVSDGAPYINGEPVLPINKMDFKLFKSSKLLDSKRIYFKEMWFKSSEIIKYCANKYGGVHLDFNRTKDWQITIEEASNYFVAGNPDGLKDMGIIEPYSEKHQVLLVLPKEQGNLWNCLDIELLAITQSFANIHADGELVAEIAETTESPNMLERLLKMFKLKKGSA